MIMGHQDKNTFHKSYLSKTSSTDIQSLFLGHKSKAKAFIAAYEVLERDIRVPQSLPILEHLALHKNLRKGAFDNYREQWFKEHSTSGMSIHTTQLSSACRTGWRFIFRREFGLPKHSVTLKARPEHSILWTTLLFSAETCRETFIILGRYFYQRLAVPVTLVVHGTDSPRAPICKH
jgi:hypothetical protein